jgi:hypothetical protein
MEQLRFKDFAKLKCGRDQFSAMRVASLQAAVSFADREQIEGVFAEPCDQAKAYRWILRGLPIEKAIRKVKTDQEITANAYGEH